MVSETVHTETVAKVVEEIEPTTAVFIEPAEKFAGGSGTKEDPYQISNAQELALLSELCTREKYNELDVDEALGYIKGYYVLTAEIQLNDTSDIANWGTKAPKWQWQPIGETYRFEGNFDGKGHTIKGMYIYSTLLVDGNNTSDPGNAPGLFGNITDALVQNVNLEDSYILVKGNAYQTGGIVSDAVESDIINCNSSVVIENSREDGGELGGIVGSLYGGTIQNCTFAGEINSENSLVYAGGIAGSASKFYKISRCINKGKISNTIEDALTVTIGGIIGTVSAGEESFIEQCINESELKPKSGFDVGGIAGRITADMLLVKEEEELIHKAAHLTVSECVNKGELRAMHEQWGTVGGISAAISIPRCLVDDEVTDMGVKIVGCRNEGTIEARLDGAGIIGQCYGDGIWILEECTNSGTVAGKSHAGGIVASSEPGRLENKMIHCINQGEISSDGAVGGILELFSRVAYYAPDDETKDVIVEDCLNRGTVTGGSIAGGIAGGIQSLLSDSTPVSVLRIRDCVNEGVIKGEEIGKLGVVLGEQEVSGALDSKGEAYEIMKCKNVGKIIQEK